ncbi:MAG: ferric reductase-like transmembrane domain-containing protein [Candidatus Moranbacteria bacterium]|nr:ferric reductase-like transmembrane domain-containing protein [Candidatus Moranbacteria bacterium]
MKSKIISYSFIVVATFSLLTFSFARAEEDEIKKVDYNKEVIVDSDLDGLTDKGEQQIYNTNPASIDSDGDSYLDGAEVLADTDPMDAQDYPGHRALDIAKITDAVNQEIPWAWYVSRAAGILGFIFLWITIFLGLSIRNPLLKRFIEPIYSFDFHCFTAAVAVFWALVHGTSFLFDSMIGFGIKDVAIPFYTQSELIHGNALALGIMAFYAMVVMTITSYLRAHMSHWLWRALHFLNPLAFIFVVIHGYVIGTDMKNFYIGSAFLFSSFLLALIYLSSLVFVIVNKFKRKDEHSN